MSDLSAVAAIDTTTPQLPVHWYFDPQSYEHEKRLLFDHGPGYIGHELMVPNVGDYQTLDWFGHAKALMRNHHGVELLSNVCRHRQAVILKGRSCSRVSTRPALTRHRWKTACSTSMSSCGGTLNRTFSAVFSVE